MSKGPGFNRVRSAIPFRLLALASLLACWTMPAAASSTIAFVDVKNQTSSNFDIKVVPVHSQSGVVHTEGGNCVPYFPPTPDVHQFTIKSGASCVIAVMASYAADNKTEVRLDVIENGKVTDNHSLTIERHKCTSGLDTNGNKFHWRFHDANRNVLDSGPESKCNTSTPDANFSWSVQ